MRIRVLAVGRLRAGPERDLAARYLDRIDKAGRAVGITVAPVVEIAESRASGETQRRDQEAEAVLRAAEKADFVFLLDERGEALSSTAFAAALADLRERAAEVVFVIAGADGAGRQLRKAAHRSIAFGALTWPHQLVRIMLAEQLYRAVTILAGHPYHREG